MDELDLALAAGADADADAAMLPADGSPAQRQPPQRQPALPAMAAELAPALGAGAGGGPPHAARAAWRPARDAMDVPSPSPLLEHYRALFLDMVQRAIDSIEAAGIDEQRQQQEAAAVKAAANNSFVHLGQVLASAIAGKHKNSSNAALADAIEGRDQAMRRSLQRITDSRMDDLAELASAEADAMLSKLNAGISNGTISIEHFLAVASANTDLEKKLSPEATGHRLNMTLKNLYALLDVLCQAAGSGNREASAAVPICSAALKAVHAQLNHLVALQAQLGSKEAAEIMHACCGNTVGVDNKALDLLATIAGSDSVRKGLSNLLAKPAPPPSSTATAALTSLSSTATTDEKLNALISCMLAQHQQQASRQGGSFGSKRRLHGGAAGGGSNSGGAGGSGGGNGGRGGYGGAKGPGGAPSN